MTQRFLTPVQALRGLGQRLRPRLRSFRDLSRWLPYLWRQRLGQPAGDYQYRYQSWSPESPPLIAIILPADRVTAQDAAAWCARQTLDELPVLSFDSSGRSAWWLNGEGEVPPNAEDALWFYAPRTLPDVDPAFLESCQLVATAERLDAVAMLDGRSSKPPVHSTDDLLSPALRPYCLFSGRAYTYRANQDTVEPRPGCQLAKVVSGGVEPARDRSTFHRQRRGPYLSSAPLPPILTIGLRDATEPEEPPEPSDRPRMMVTVPFLARGGAEHTLFETARVMARDFEITFVTLAPHRPELGDRRDDFRQISDRILCLGDLVHPAAMPGVLGRWIDQLGIDIIYNANSTTLFYDFFPRLKADRPKLRIVDHLYDHRIGYIDRYEDRELLRWIDACVAENHRIAERLVDELGWPAERVPVIWPCGRSSDAFPKDFEAARQEVRRELGIGKSDFLILIAARMHEQKRPLDVVAVADRVRDLEGLHFLIVGGGDLEAQVDSAIERAAGAPVRRLPFRTDIPRLIVGADVGCLLSEHEGLPVFMLECLQAGRPFLGTDAGEMSAVLSDTGAGLITGEPGDLDAIEAAVRRLYDPALRAELAGRAVDAGRRFDVASCARRYADVLRGKELQAEDPSP